MSEDRLSGAWATLRQFGPTGAAAALMYAGTSQMVEVLKYTFGSLIIDAINTVLQQRFRGSMLLPNYGLVSFLPVAFRMMAVGVSVMAAGIGIGFGFTVGRRDESLKIRER